MVDVELLYRQHLSDADRRLLSDAAGAEVPVSLAFSSPALEAVVFDHSDRSFVSVGVSPFLAFATAVHRTAAVLETASFVEERWAPTCTRSGLRRRRAAGAGLRSTSPVLPGRVAGFLYTRRERGHLDTYCTGLASAPVFRAGPKPPRGTARGRRAQRALRRLPPARRPGPVPAGRLSRPCSRPRQRRGHRPAVEALGARARPCHRSRRQRHPGAARSPLVRGGGVLGNRQLHASDGVFGRCGPCRRAFQGGPPGPQRGDGPLPFPFA